MTKAQVLRQAILAENCTYISMKDGYGTMANGGKLKFNDVIGEAVKEVKSNYSDSGKLIKYIGLLSDKSKIVYAYNTRHHQVKLTAK